MTLIRHISKNENILSLQLIIFPSILRRELSVELIQESSYYKFLTQVDII